MDADSRLLRIEQELALLKGGQANLEQGQAKLEQGQAKLEQGQAELKATLAQVQQLLARIDGRLDEQRATINALIPTRIAAVPPAAE